MGSGRGLRGFRGVVASLFPPLVKYSHPHGKGFVQIVPKSHHMYSSFVPEAFLGLLGLVWRFWPEIRLIIPLLSADTSAIRCIWNHGLHLSAQICFTNSYLILPTLLPRPLALLVVCQNAARCSWGFSPWLCPKSFLQELLRSDSSCLTSLEASCYWDLLGVPKVIFPFRR